MPTTTFALAGSTHHSVTMAQALLAAGFKAEWVLTPVPKPVGRDQVITANPVQLWAESQQLEVIQVHKKIDDTIRNQVLGLPPVEILLVVDFGYLVPEWLLQLPKVAPVNVHPSALPRWRGSSPGQFSLLFGDQSSATSIMIMDSGLDTGPILAQAEFSLEPTWTQTEYYQKGFEVAAQLLPSTLQALTSYQVTPQPQPNDSPTPVARQLSKSDSFVAWSVIEALSSGNVSGQLDPADTSQLLQTAAEHQSWTQTISQATRAFQPWPTLWTLAPTTKGPKRLKILSLSHTETNLVLERVQFEGQQPAAWPQVKNLVLYTHPTSTD